MNQLCFDNADKIKGKHYMSVYESVLIPFWEILDEGTPLIAWRSWHSMAGKALSYKSLSVYSDFKVVNEPTVITKNTLKPF